MCSLLTIHLLTTFFLLHWPLPLNLLLCLNKCLSCYLIRLMFACISYADTYLCLPIASPPTTVAWQHNPCSCYALFFSFLCQTLYIYYLSKPYVLGYFFHSPAAFLCFSLPATPFNSFVTMTCNPLPALSHSCFLLIALVSLIWSL